MGSFSNPRPVHDTGSLSHAAATIALQIYRLARVTLATCNDLQLSETHNYHYICHNLLVALDVDSLLAQNALLFFFLLFSLSFVICIDVMDMRSPLGISRRLKKKSGSGTLPTVTLHRLGHVDALQCSIQPSPQCLPRSCPLHGGLPHLK